MSRRHALALLAASPIVAAACGRGERSLSPDQTTSVTTPDGPATTWVTDRSGSSPSTVVPSRPSSALAPWSVTPTLLAFTDNEVVPIGDDGALGVAQPLPSLVSANGRWSVATSVVNGRTTATWRSLTNAGKLAYTASIDGEFDANALSFSGDVIGLSRAEGAAGSPRTQVALLGWSGESWQAPFNADLLPEAIGDSPGSINQRQAFAIETLHNQPIAGVDPYRVTVVDPSAGQLRPPFNLRNKGEPLDEKMAGLSRRQLAVVEQDVLFTLYRGVEADGRKYSFVHTLWLMGGAYCVLLPDELELDELEGAMSLNGGSLIVASPNGLAATVDITDVIQIGNVAPSVARFTDRSVTSALVVRASTGWWTVDGATLFAPDGSATEFDAVINDLIADGRRGVYVAAGPAVWQMSADGVVSYTAHNSQDVTRLQRIAV